MTKKSQSKTKRIYQKPKIESEPVAIAALATSCNGKRTGSSGRKAGVPCTVLLS